MEDYTFETGNAGSAGIDRVEAGGLHKGQLVMIKDHPCKVMNFSTAKTGKHGSAKCMITGIDIFTSQKYECTYGSGDMVDAPIVNRIEYTLINIDDEGFCSLMTEAGDIKEDLKLPTDDHLKEIV